MKKLIILPVLFLTLMLSGCATKYSEEQVNSLIQQEKEKNNLEMAKLQDQINELKQDTGTKATSESSVNTNQGAVSQPSSTVDEYQGWNIFSNSNGGYSFKYFSTWGAFVSQYNNKNSLFGPSASNSSGLGGVEVSSYSGNLETYLDNMEKDTEIKYLTRENVTVNGVAGIRVEYKGSPVSGFSVFLKNGNKVFNIFVNSKDATNVNLFNKLVASFAISN